MKTFFLRYYSIIYILLVWLLFSFPYFFQGLVPYPSTYQVNFFPPWRHYQEWAGPVKNNAMPDVIDQIYPWKHFTIEWMKQGVIPLWNPYNFAGNPHVGNYQSAVYSPFNLFYFILPFIDAWSLTVLLQPLIAGLSTYLFVRELKISKAGSILASVSYMFCGFIVVWMAYGTLSMAIAFLPLALYSIEKVYASKKIRYLLFFPITIAISFFSGHFQTSLYFALYTLCFILFKIITNKKEKKLHFFVIMFFIIGILISLLQVIPTIRLYSTSVRSELVHAGGGIPFDHLITIVAPDFFGNPVTRNDWVGNYAEWASFIGIIPFFFALVSVLKGKKQTIFFGCMAFITLLLSMDTPIHSLLIKSGIPVIATSIPSRMIVLSSFSLAILSAFGMDAYVNRHAKKETLFIIFFLGVALSIVIFSLAVFHVLPDEKNNLALKNSIVPIVFWFILTVFIAGEYIFKNIKKLSIGISILILLATIDSLRFGSKWMPFDPRSLVFPEVPVIAAMKKNIGNGRVFGNLGTEVTTYYGLSSLEGYDPLYNKRYGELVRYAIDGTWLPAERSVAKIDRKGKYTDTLIDLLAVTILFHPRADTNQVWAYPIWEKEKKYTLVYEDKKFQIFRNNTALPRAALFYNYVVKQNGHDILATLFSKDFSFRNTLLLEKKPLRVEKTHVGVGKVEIVSYMPNKVTIHVESSAPALLFLSDTFYPQWLATLNGKKTEIFRADYAFRAVEVPKGKSTVEFIYRELF